MPVRQDESDQSARGSEQGLKGTFAAVLLLGAFIVVSWSAVFLLFMNR